MPDKFEREINEILSKIDDFPKHAAQRRRRSSKLGRVIGERQRNLAVRLTRLTVTQVMLTAFAVMAFSFFILKDTFPAIWVYGLILGLILFFTAFAMSYRGGAPGRSEPYFRGRPKSYYRDDAPQVWSRLRVWWQRQRRRRQ